MTKYVFISRVYFVLALLKGYLTHCHKPDHVVRVLHCTELTPSSPILAEHTFKSE